MAILSVLSRCHMEAPFYILDFYHYRVWEVFKINSQRKQKRRRKRDCESKKGSENESGRERREKRKKIDRKRDR